MHYIMFAGPAVIPIALAAVAAAGTAASIATRPKPQTPQLPKPPVPADAAKSVQVRNEEAAALKRQGFASTILGGAQSPGTGGKTLLGS